MIVTVGSIALDSIETPQHKAEDVLGGSATFISAAASKLAPAAVIGIVGDDFPEHYRDLFQKWGVNTSGLEVVPGKTFRWGCRYHPDMIHRDTLFTDLGVFATFEPKVPEELTSSPYVALGNIHPDQQQSVLNQMKAPKWVLADTMKLWLDIARPSLDQLISRVDCLVVNDEEARQLTGKISLTAAASEILDRGPSSVIIKRGEHGASMHTREGMFVAPAFPLHHITDTTGAGDTFLGGLVGWVAKQGETDAETIRQGILIGSCLAAYTVESSGLDHLDAVSLAELGERIRVIRDLTRVGEVSLY
jgi:sugar/nucleoside kinase (ribokinase family)